MEELSGAELLQILQQLGSFFCFGTDMRCTIGDDKKLDEILREVNRATPEQWDGKIPLGKGHELVAGGYANRWVTRYGGGEISDCGEMWGCDFRINNKISLFITGDFLHILDCRYSGKLAFLFYMSRPAWNPGPYGFPLEHEKIEEILSVNIPECVYWDMVLTKAREIYDQNR